MAGFQVTLPIGIEYPCIVFPRLTLSDQLGDAVIYDDIFFFVILGLVNAMGAFPASATGVPSAGVKRLAVKVVFEDEDPLVTDERSGNLLELAGFHHGACSVGALFLCMSRQKAAYGEQDEEGGSGVHDIGILCDVFLYDDRLDGVIHQIIADTGASQGGEMGAAT